MPPDAPAPAPTSTAASATPAAPEQRETKELPLAPEGSSAVLGDLPARNPERGTTQMSPEKKAKYAAMFKASAAKAGVSASGSALDDDEVVQLGAPAAPAAPSPATATPVATQPAAQSAQAAPPVLPAIAEALSKIGNAEDERARAMERERGIAAKAALDAREAELAAREKALAEKEQRYRDTAERFAADPIGLTLEFVKSQLPADATQQQIDSAFADAVTEMSFVAGKITPPAEMMESLSMKRQVRELQANAKREAKARAEAEARAKKEREEAEAAQREVARAQTGVATVKAHLGDTAKYEWLHRAADPHQLVWDAIDLHHRNTGEILDLDVAAQMIDGLLEKEVTSLGKYHDLLSRKFRPAETPAAPAPAAASTPPAAHQGGHQDRPSAPAAATAASAEQPQPQEWDADAHRNATLRKWRAKMPQATGG